MVKVNTVLGPIDTKDLGFTLMHEHLMFSFPGMYKYFPECLGPDSLGRIVEDLKQAKDGGVDTIVEASPHDLGRDIELLAEASIKSGVNIIASSGWWMGVLPFFEGVDVEPLTEAFIREVETGIGDTGIKAGIYKSASDVGGVTKQATKVLKAIGRAHLKTGVPIMLHSHAATQLGRQQLAILQEEGVNPKRVKIEHANDTTDLEYLTWLLEQGCYLGMDRIPRTIPSTRARTNTMKALIDAGWADRLCPSHDRAIINLVEDTPQWKSTHPDNPYGFLFVKEDVFKQLREMGVSENIINSLCINGPRNFFEGA